MPSDYFNDLRIGAEFRAHPNISVRAGYRHEFGTSGDPATGLSYGLGVNFRQLNVDYSMTPSNDFDNVQRLSFGYSFGSGATEQQPAPKKPKPTKPAPPAAPTGPAVITRSEPKAPAPKPAAPPPDASKAVVITPALPAPTPAVNPPAASPAAPETVPPAVAPEAPQKPAAPTEYAVVLPGFSSKESAEAEIKALQLLGFKTKDAKIAQDPKRGGYVITLTRMKSKGKADEMASSLQRMSFRAIVDLAQK